MLNLTVQIYAESKWHDAFELTFDAPDKGFASRCSFGYDQHYLVDHLDQIATPFANAVSVRFPLQWDSYRTQGAPAFLHDIAPSGAAKRFLMAHMGRDKPDDISAELFLLMRSAPAPIGHMRIKESVAMLDSRPPMGFARQEVIQRDNRFLEYAYEQGAAIGGATGAGGEAPKLLLAENHHGELYPDAVLDDAQVRQHWFVKFARNKGMPRDQDILRSEYHYYRALQALGIETVAAQGLALEEANKPSLWMQRFDRHVGPQGVERYAVESIYSMAGVTVPGSAMGHREVVEQLVGLWRQAGQCLEVPALVAEYLKRDLLNKILGNSDNHGRNTSIIRHPNALHLAPIYDLAPMVMDDEGITRTTKWPREFERAGEVDWLGVCHLLGDLVDSQTLFEGLRDDAQRLLALPDILSDNGLPSMTMNHPGISLKNLPQRLQEWGLK
ncbi:type II toxin-antitoxin system HipA family toxin [Pseudomonas kairouanensis]|uniref:Type II toxin-antitoxin system HipA family toxin n=1 Tax=Pseudomonas kairouanensis TaxID=2293832 RepID=A0A4Z0ASX1_9PSED|nr:HipA domain-containing protein [Pseudomonas kairouanensis]TFY89501.1 type II toxin-antitoxin system HipA family toxin [Pseudomonas kairouanensis]